MSDDVEGEEGPQPLDLTALELEQLMGLFVGILSAKAWQYMGLRVAPGKEEAEKDLAKAATAIDCVSYVVDKLALSVTEEELSGLKSMLADLQINYARQA